MEVLEMEENQETKNTESHLSSAAAFVEGGIQEACDDACSICLEDFCDSDPSTVTSCKHEFHLQCILEWCQRSSQCPMCWQSIHLKDPSSQELLEAVERERNIRFAPPRHATIFHHPTLGDFELQHLPVGATDADLEERIIQHLAAAAAMGRAHHYLGRRDGHRGRPSSHNRPHFLLLSAHPGTHAGTASAPVGDDPEEPVGAASPSSPSISSSASGNDSSGPDSSRQIPVQDNQIYSSTSGATVLTPINGHGTAFANRSSDGRSASAIQDRAGPSDFQSFSDSLKSKWNAVSMRYKESISKSTRGWKEKLFARNTAMADASSVVRREENEGVNRIALAMEQASIASDSTDDSSANRSLISATNQRIAENPSNIPLSDGNPSSAAPASASTLSN